MAAKRILKCIFAVLGGVITFNAVALFFVSNLNLGNFLLLFLGLCILAAATLSHKTLEKIPKWFKIIFVSLLCIAVCFTSFLIIYGSRDTADFSEDAVIVLGAAVHGKTPSLTLKRRLDAAVAYNEQNPDALIVVSGGKGNQEDITEAEAMEKYLTEHGVSKDVIIKEDKAVSTYTNFKYSKELLDERLGGEYKAAFITNDFHIFRASLCARQGGIDSITHYHSDTNLSYILSASLRECLAVIYYLIFKG